MSATEEDVVHSDVHVFTNYQSLTDVHLAVSRFYFRIPQKNEEADSNDARDDKIDDKSSKLTSIKHKQSCGINVKKRVIKSPHLGRRKATKPLVSAVNKTSNSDHSQELGTQGDCTSLPTDESLLSFINCDIGRENSGCDDQDNNISAVFDVSRASYLEQSLHDSLLKCHRIVSDSLSDVLNDNQNTALNNPDRESDNPNRESDNPNRESDNPNRESDNPNRESDNPDRESDNPNRESDNPNRESDNLSGNNSSSDFLSYNVIKSLSESNTMPTYFEQVTCNKQKYIVTDNEVSKHTTLSTDSISSEKEAEVSIPSCSDIHSYNLKTDRSKSNKIGDKTEWKICGSCEQASIQTVAKCISWDQVCFSHASCNCGEDEVVSTDKTLDEDGDVMIKRRRRIHDNLGVITIAHNTATSLDGVGKQIWLGALLLCDFIHHHATLFRDANVLDLGAGVGLTSIVAGMYAKNVFCTDVDESVLNLATKNVNMNKSLCCNSTGVIGVKVRKLDWFKDSLTICEDEASLFAWIAEDIRQLADTDILLAADVIYDCDLTDAFFACVYNLMTEISTRTLYIALERRLVFTVPDLCVSSPAYDHFRQWLEALENSRGDGVCFHVEQLSTDFPQNFKYNRAKELELWIVRTSLEDCYD